MYCHAPPEPDTCPLCRRERDDPAFAAAVATIPAPHQTCECQADGFCRRYGRDMRGRDREICRGDNVDLGEAAKLRLVWAKEAREKMQQDTVLPDCPHRGPELREDGHARTRVCGPCGGKKLKLFPCTHPARQPEEVTATDCQACDYRPRPPTGRPLLLKNNLCPGDVLVMTAAVYSLHKAHPGKYRIAVETTAMQLWEHNPDVLPAVELPNAEPVEMHYPAIDQCNQRGIHMMQGFTEWLENILGVRIPLATNRPHVYLSREERTWLPQVEELTHRTTRYWVVNAGRKNDFTAKWAGTDFYQRVVDLCRGKVQFVQIGEASPTHHHPPLRGALNLVGKTDTRQLMRLCYHATGGIGGVTFLQHLMAALERPYVCVMGGREPVQWNEYPRQQLLHTIGALPCCSSGGCWKSRTVPLGDGDEKDKSLCDNPEFGDVPLPRCMAMIRPEEAADKILRIVS